MAESLPAIEKLYEQVEHASPAPAEKSILKRAVLAGLGVLFVGIAAVGVVLPGVPTAGPLIIASIFLTKSSPSLERKLIRNRFFARYLIYLDGSREMPPRAKAMAIVLMWLSILISSIVLTVSGGSPIWLLIILTVAGLVGTVFIARYGRPAEPSANERPDAKRLTE